MASFSLMAANYLCFITVTTINFSEGEMPEFPTLQMYKHRAKILASVLMISGCYTLKKKRILQLQM